MGEKQKGKFGVTGNKLLKGQWSFFKAVVNENVTYGTLKALMDIPCSANTFYDRRRKFYWLLAKEL